jgi:UDP-N-acetylglucosamine--N-acetylmuramyl-(pentapeptide) pyrophosphoryl-undecaprenol N-acetylglucosamine transferase
LLPQALRARLEIVQQSRPEDIAAARDAFAATGVKVELSSFFNDVPARLASCHLAITRSGASTIAELGVAGRPAILVPYPFATDDHQTANAQAFASGGAGWVIGQRGFTALALAERLKAILATPEILVQAAASARQQGQPDAAERLSQVIIGHIEAGAKSSTPAWKGLAA